MTNEQLINLSQDIKRGVLSTMEQMLAFGKKYPKAALPQPENDFIGAKMLMERGEFNLAVCGKVKNGKSSLINALIGRNLLPVCTDVATSRVFKISHAEKDSFFVVYDNGDRKSITQDDLAVYGSQATIDEQGLAEADKSIAYIEVNTKIDFLPKGVAIIDTPGIGSTYPHHTTITREYLKLADAALFVANPTPLEKTEIDFLKDVVNVTPNIMFVTTKVDMNGEESVNEAIARNTKLINEAVGNRLARKVEMLRMSSKLLLEANDAEEEEWKNIYVENSHYNEVKEELLRTVFLTQGYYRAGVAYNSAIKYYRTMLGALQNRMEGAKKQGKEFERMLDQYEKAREVFTERMGDKKKAEVLAEVTQILNTMQGEFTKIFTPSTSGTIYDKYWSEIDNLTSDEVSNYKQNLGSNLVNEARNEWEKLTATVYQRMMEALNKYNDECRMVMPKETNLTTPDSAGAPEISEMTFKDTMTAARTEILTAGLITTSATTIVTGLNVLAPALLAPAMPILTPALAVIGVGVLLWGALAGKKAAEQKKLQKDKASLTKFVQDTLIAIRRQLVETSLQDGKYTSQYQGFVISVNEQAQKSVSDTYTKYKTELDAMRKTLLESKQNPKLIEALEIMVNEWKKQETNLTEVKTQLDKVEV